MSGYFGKTVLDVLGKRVSNILGKTVSNILVMTLNNTFCRLLGTILAETIFVQKRIETISNILVETVL